MKRKNLLAALIMLVASFSAIANEYTAGKYSLSVEQYGDFSLLYDGEPLLFSRALQVSNSKWEWIFFDRQFIPKLTTEQKGDTTTITLSLSRPGVIDNFKQTMTLSPNGLEIMYTGLLLSDIFDIENSLNLSENVFAGEKYSCRIHTGQTAEGVFSEERPGKSEDDMCKGYIMKGNFDFELGTLVVESYTNKLRLQDYRNSPKISYFSLGWVLRNTPKGSELKQGYKISVHSADGI